MKKICSEEFYGRRIIKIMLVCIMCNVSYRSSVILRGPTKMKIVLFRLFSSPKCMQFNVNVSIFIMESQ